MGLSMSGVHTDCLVESAVPGRTAIDERRAENAEQ
jgi:hypothetical protein